MAGRMTTIQVSAETKQKLKELKTSKSEPYDSVIVHLLHECEIMKRLLNEQ